MSRQTTVPSNGTPTQSAVAAATADLAAPSVPASTSRLAVEFYNNSDVAIYVSTSPTYAEASVTGRPVPSGQSWTDASTGAAWYVFAASGSGKDVRITIVS